jgi:hypothetical protein
MELIISQELLSKLDTLDNRLEAIQLILKVMAMRIDLMETRIDYRFDRIAEEQVSLT